MPSDVPATSFIEALLEDASVPEGSCCEFGSSFLLRAGSIVSSCSEKSKSGGNGLEVGSLQLGSLNSSKNSCAIACIGVNRAVGVYRSNLETRSTASCGVLGRKT